MQLDFVEHIRREGSLLRAALVSADASAAVPSCPGWVGDDLLQHMCVVLGFWATVVEGRLTSPPAGARPSRPAHRSELLASYDAQLARMVRTLQDSPDDVAVWSWSADQTVGFVRRRVAHEVLIHRLDAQLTAGAVTAVDADLATDGVDELLRHFFRGPAWSQFTAERPVGRLRTLDTGAQWVVQIGHVTGLSRDGQSRHDRQPGFCIADAAQAADHPTFTVSANAGDLDAWLWRRRDGSGVIVIGDEADAARFTAILAEGIR